ncbi:MAG TPA: sigma-70 family RNA polymerase sigma factor [Blastocatellia bacterium]|nr:sigma-70 family RNA polymerase sigma factor [Blastocatellia bacterium]
MERSDRLSQSVNADGVVWDIDALFSAYYKGLARLLRRVVADNVRAEELAAEAFCRLYYKPPRKDINIEAWLYRTGLRLAFDYLKMERRRAHYEERASWFGVVFDPDKMVEQGEEQARVRRVLASLKPIQASLLLLRSEGFSYSELAIVLDLNEGSVGTLLSRAKQAFRKEYVRRYGEQG